MNIHVRIDRLILDGLPIERSQGPLVRAAVEEELARVLTEHGLTDKWGTGGATHRIHGADMTVAGDSQPTGLGRQIARSVFEGIVATE